MRRKDREITDKKELLDILKRGRICRIAFWDKEYPYIVPVNYGVKETDNQEVWLYIHGTDTGKKIELLKKNDKVGFETDTYEDYRIGSLTTEYESIIGYGTMEIVPKEKEKKEALQLILDSCGENTASLTERMIQQTEVFRLKIIGMSGKKNKPKS